MPPHFFDGSHVFERSIQRVCGRAHRVDHRIAGSVGRNARFLASGAGRLGGDPRVLAGGAGRLSGLAQPFSFLSYGLERLSIMVTDFTRFLGEAPDLFRFVPGRLGRHHIFGTTMNLAVTAPVIHEIPDNQRMGSCARGMS